MPKTFILLVAFAISLSAQSSISVTVTTPRNSATATIKSYAAPAITAFSCTPADVLEGDSVTCSVTVDRTAPPFGYVLRITYPAGFAGSPNVTIPGGTSSATFSFVVPVTTAPTAMLIGPDIWTRPLAAFAPLANTDAWAWLHKPVNVERVNVGAGILPAGFTWSLASL